MADHNIKVTDLELVILQQIWNLDDNATVNQIIEAWQDDEPPGYTTVLKTLQKMEEKNIVAHRSQGRMYSYYPLVSKQQVTNKRLGTIVDRIFSGDRLSFAQYFLEQEDFDPQELKELKKLINKKEKEAKQ